jgi:hypothetical protein
MAAICIGDRIRCKDGVEGTVTDLHKYRNERHVVIKTDNGEEWDLKVQTIARTGFTYFLNILMLP